MVDLREGLQWNSFLSRLLGRDKKSENVKPDLVFSRGHAQINRLLITL